MTAMEPFPVRATDPSLKQSFVPVKRLLLVGALVSIASANAGAVQTTKVTPLLSRGLTGVAGKQGAMMTMEYAPGAADPVHLVGRNASRTKLAKFFASFVKDKGAPVVMPVQ